MKCALIFLPALALAGCVSPIGNGVLRSSADVPRNARLMISAPNPAIQAATEATLMRLGYRIGPLAEFVLEAVYSERPLGVSFEADGGLNSGSEKLPNFVPCSQRIQRLTLVITEARTGRPAYQGQAEVTQCVGAKEDNFIHLANAALAKLQPTFARP
jgi:hypothetical protein